MSKDARDLFLNTLFEQKDFRDKDYARALSLTFQELNTWFQSSDYLSQIEKDRQNKPLLRTTLMNTVHESLQEINENHKDPQEVVSVDTLGCTATVVMCDYTSQTILVANLGLLKCVVGYKSGEYEVLTTDHGKTIDDFPFSKALGTKKYKFSAEPSITEFEMPEDLDFVFVASDGVWELF